MGSIVNKLYPAFVRTHLEFASAVRNFMTKSEINKVEGIQKRATKMVIELRGLEYEEKLRELGLTDLETRRKRGNLLQIFKIKKGFEKRVSEGTSRRHNSQITRDKQGGKMRDKFLLNRTATTWNLLPSEIAGTDTVNQFKAKIDRHMKSETWRRSVYRI
ncbi:RNA-directed DNA polymerase from mobile element jockey-like [Brachionus plicatilis]|uniref:RNA-directed DNA polymerase from mobile element jockey-like n=1 Tax=Brachionus plicatilis TaxID=10195 RepID=A0A3M7RKV7_BRAPC|nr:RNA-directed DNA polymerase from mobile element jockey-like [Brachionus plicatilis]